jgi:hypothetical protein
MIRDESLGEGKPEQADRTAQLGSVAEWTIAPGCKLDGFSLRRFESSSAHNVKGTIMKCAECEVPDHDSCPVELPNAHECPCCLDTIFGILDEE